MENGSKGNFLARNRVIMELTLLFRVLPQAHRTMMLSWVSVQKTSAQDGGVGLGGVWHRSRSAHDSRGVSSLFQEVDKAHPRSHHSSDQHFS